jgi:hypothetical protein
MVSCKQNLFFHYIKASGLKEAGMINRSTINVLNLKPVTRSMCYDFYQKINTEFNTPDAIRESVSWWQDNKDKLNELWWVLNYYSESLDPERELRARVEHHLDILALEKTAAPDPCSDPSTALEQS